MLMITLLRLARHDYRIKYRFAIALIDTPHMRVILLPAFLISAERHALMLSLLLARLSEKLMTNLAALRHHRGLMIYFAKSTD